MYRLLLSSTTDARWPLRGVYVSLTSPPEMLKSGLQTAASAAATTPRNTIAINRSNSRPGAWAIRMTDLRRNIKAGGSGPPALTLVPHTAYLGSARRLLQQRRLERCRLHRTAHHLARLHEVDARRYVTVLVAHPVPANLVRPRRRLLTALQRPNQPTVYPVDPHRHRPVVLHRVGNRRLRIERIRVRHRQDRRGAVLDPNRHRALRVQRNRTARFLERPRHHDLRQAVVLDVVEQVREALVREPEVDVRHAVRVHVAVHEEPRVRRALGHEAGRARVRDPKRRRIEIRVRKQDLLDAELGRAVSRLPYVDRRAEVLEKELRADLGLDRDRGEIIVAELRRAVVTDPKASDEAPRSQIRVHRVRIV